MSGINLEALPADILQSVREKQVASEKRGIKKSLEEIYRGMMSERLQGLKNGIKKEYPQ